MLECSNEVWLARLPGKAKAWMGRSCWSWSCFTRDVADDDDECMWSEWILHASFGGDEKWDKRLFGIVFQVIPFAALNPSFLFARHFFLILFPLHVCRVSLGSQSSTHAFLDVGWSSSIERWGNKSKCWKPQTLSHTIWMLLLLHPSLALNFFYLSSENSLLASCSRRRVLSVSC